MRQELLEYFENSWALTEVLFTALRTEEAFYRPPAHRLRHPLIFYYGHPAVLYVNKFRLAGLVNGPVNPEFERIFEVGVDEMSWDDLSQTRDYWPSAEAVEGYRRRVHDLVRGVIETHPTLDRETVWAILMGIEHERIHLETSSVLMRELPAELVQRPPRWPEYPAFNGELSANPLVDVAAGEVTIGKSRAEPTFGWDNEYGSKTVSVPAFRVTQTLISNGEFLGFVQASGYGEQRFWSEEGWKWRTFRNTKWPVFWIPEGPQGLHEYKLRLCFEVVPMQWSWPAIVNYHEAKAYCAWRSECDKTSTPYRLLTEAEHHRIREWPQREPNFGLRFGSEGAVDSNPFGNAWQWSEDHAAALPGFRVDPLYEDFSLPCFDGKHHLILGGSFISTGDEISRFARFHFRPHFFQHAGFRMVQPSNRYGTDAGLSQYLLLHYGSREETSPFPLPENAIGFPRRCAAMLGEVTSGRALDLGCAVGGATFELARWFDSVLGIDLSERFIEAADTLRTDGRLEYEFGTALVDPVIDRNRVHFSVGDACALPAGLRPFDAVLLANLLCRLRDPKALLTRLTELVNPGGFVLIALPYSWMSEYTPAENRLSAEALRALMAPHFELVRESDEPLLIREHARKFEYIVSHVTLWRSYRSANARASSPGK